jgi:YD repeat-containing protein
MKKLLFLPLYVVSCLAVADEVHRDANGKIIRTETKTGGTTTVRDNSGKVVEQKTTTGGTTTVRDSSGKVIRTETKR